MSNREIRLYASGKGVRLWELAKRLGISENTLTRRLRDELSKEKAEEFTEAVDAIAAEKEAE